MNSTNKLKLLAGLPIPMSDFSCFIHPITLKEISVLGIENFFKYVNLLTITHAEIATMLGEEVSPFTFLLVNSTHSESFKIEFCKAMEVFLKEKITLLPEVQSISIGNFEDSRILTEENFEEFQSILRKQNFISEEEIKFTGENDAAKIIKAKLEKAKATIERLKKSNESDPIELADLISSLTIKTSINIISVWDLSYYTFNDQFKRMRILEQYNTGLQSIMAGADPKKIKLKDWIQNIR